MSDSGTKTAASRRRKDMLYQKCQSTEGCCKQTFSAHLCFITTLHCIFSEHDKPDAGASLPNGMRLSKLEYADGISMVDETA